MDNQFLKFKGNIVQIREEGDSLTWAIVSDGAWNIYYLLYLGTVEFIAGDGVSFIGVPLGIHWYKNKQGDDVSSVAMLACCIYK